MTVEEIKKRITDAGADIHGEREFRDVILELLLSIADSLERLLAKP